MPSNHLPRLVILTQDHAWLQTILQALMIEAKVNHVTSVGQLRTVRVDEEWARAAVLIDQSGVANIEILTDLVTVLATTSVVSVVYTIPEWRETVALMRAGAYDYVRKSTRLAATRAQLMKLLAAATQKGDLSVDE